VTTLREQAAIAAMQEVLLNDKEHLLTHEDIAQLAVRQADALLAELARTAPKDAPATPPQAWVTTCTMCDGTGYFDQGEVSGRCSTCKGTGERHAAREALPRAGGDQ